MKNWNKTRWLILTVASIVNIATAFGKIKSIDFIDIFAVFGLEAIVLSWCFFLSYKSNSNHFIKSDSKLVDIFKKALTFIFRLEVFLVITFFLLYSYKSYFAFQSNKSFLVLIVMILLNNFIIIAFLQAFIAWSKNKLKSKGLININIIITFVVVMTNLPLIQYNRIFEEILYYSPFPGFFLVWINPNLEATFFLVVPYSSLFLPFIILYKELKQGNN